MEKFDLVIVGAGWAGLAVAKTFHQLHPQKSLVIIEKAPTLGGVWAKHRLYPGLKTNNMIGTYEYPDFPMVPEDYGLKPGQHIPGHVCHAYLARCADEFDLADKIRYEQEIVTAEHQDEEGGWILTVVSAAGEKKLLGAAKLVVATGLTSESFLPTISGQESFGVPMFHGKDFAKHAGTLDSAKRVTVFGGTKTGWDAVYAYASKGIKVDWVIRESGHGPVWMAPPYVTPLKKWLEKLVHTRMLTWFSPCIWGDADGYTAMRSFFHRTALGRAITNKFWSILGNDVITLNNYDSHPETAKLKPWSQAMWVASSFSILNYDTDFFELVRNGTVNVHIADITSLSPHTVHLSNGTALQTDAMCCVTGWKHVPPIKFLPEGIEKEMGIPRAPEESDAAALEKMDAEILSRFPRLRNPPVQNAHYIPLVENKGISTTEADAASSRQKLTCWNLHRFMVPATPRLLRHRDVAFAGMMMNFSVTLIANMQALWINAYFSGEDLGLPDWSDAGAMDEMRYRTALFCRFGKWRYPAGHGSQYPDFVFDALPYVDLMVRDLGLRVHRKDGALAEVLSPYGPADYRNVLDEYRMIHRGADSKKER